MKRGKDDDKSMGPMFPRLHVNDTEKGGPRAPPRNKMALYEQLSIPSQRFNTSSTPGSMNNDRGTFSPLQQSSSIHPTRKPDNRHSDINTQHVQQEHKRRHEENDFRVPIFDQQSGTSQNRSVNHQNRENIQNVGESNNKSQKENTRDFAKSSSNQSSRQHIKAPLKGTNESLSLSHKNASKNENLRDYRVDSQADNTLWGDSGLNEPSKARGYGNNTSVPLREVQEEPNADAVSETSMVDSVCGVDISPDDVVGIIGQKHFWKARRAIVNQQRVFAVQVFELHRLIKVQRLIAGSPHLLVEDDGLVVKPPKVSPIKKIPLEYVVKSTLNIPMHKIDLEKPNDETEFSGENAVVKASVSSVQNGSQTTNCRRPSEPNMGGPWNYNPPPGHHQWLIPVMSPSEGLVYKPYPAPGFMSPVYGGGCGPPGSMPPMMGHNFPNYGIPPASDHHYEGTGTNPFAPHPLPSNGYFPAYGMQRMNTPTNPFNQASATVPSDKNESAVPNVVKSTASKDTKEQTSTTCSRNEKPKDRNALPLFPTSPPTSTPTPDHPRARVETIGPPRVIRVVPHNARSATASVARIFQSIQEERKQYDSG